MKESRGIRSRWWGRVLFGFAAIIFGLVAFLFPGLTLEVFILIFAIFVIASGVIMISYGFSRPRGFHRWLNLGEGALAIAIGLIAFFLPGATALTVAYIFGAFAIISGALQILEGLFAAEAIRARSGAYGRTLMLVSGAWSLIIGILIVLFPGAGILALVWLVALFAIVVGVINIATGLRIRRSAGAVAVD
mgnify:CR=1 FL=1